MKQNFCWFLVHLLTQKEDLAILCGKNNAKLNIVFEFIISKDYVQD